MYELDALQLLRDHVHAVLGPFYGGGGQEEKLHGEADEPVAAETGDFGEDY